MGCRHDRPSERTDQGYCLDHPVELAWFVRQVVPTNRSEKPIRRIIWRFGGSYWLQESVAEHLTGQYEI